uniref:DNA polymerase alpha subunit B n=1 Tax=Lactuca sativa TaxID=4236 RepID=A0A9R1VKK7_LACSA|nr:hypothetical protein LSAT_V11C500253640 [Lactuca sativa]
MLLYVEYMGSAARVILLPSIRDAHHDYVFPQRAFDMNIADLNHHITCITNPGMISTNKMEGKIARRELRKLKMDMIMGTSWNILGQLLVFLLVIHQ